MARLMFQAWILELDGQDKSAWFELLLLLFSHYGDSTCYYDVLLLLLLVRLLILTKISIISACSGAFCSANATERLSAPAL